MQTPGKVFSKVGFSLAAGLFWALSASQVFSQNLIQVYAVPELEPHPHNEGDAPQVRLSASQKALVENDILAAARRYWKSQGVDCDPKDGIGGFSIQSGVIEGAFTRPRAKEQAILYQYCMTGHNFANNGIVVSKAIMLPHTLSMKAAGTARFWPCPTLTAMASRRF